MSKDSHFSEQQKIIKLFTSAWEFISLMRQAVIGFVMCLMIVCILQAK